MGPLLDEMLRQLLNLFSELGLLTQKELVAAPALKVHDVQGYLGEILPAIAEVRARRSPPRMPFQHRPYLSVHSSRYTCLSCTWCCPLLNLVWETRRRSFLHLRC